MDKKGYILNDEFNSFLKTARTGDLLLFSGNTLGSRITSIFTDSPWTHVALVIKNKTTGKICLFESVMEPDGITDLKNGNCQSCGCRYISAETKIKKYRGSMCVWRKYNRNCNRDFSSSVVFFMNRYHGKPYEKSTTEMIRSSFSMIFDNKQEASDSIFCSELVALCLKQMGILPNSGTSRPANSYAPSDFSVDIGDMKCYEDMIPIIEPNHGRFSLGFVCHSFGCC